MRRNKSSVYRKLQLPIKIGMLVLLVLYINLHQGGAATASADEGQDRAAAKSEAITQASKLNEAAESVYRHALDGNITKVNEGVSQVERIFEASSFQGLTNVEGIHALAETIVEIKAVTAQVQVNSNEWLEAAAKLRMAADSLHHASQPLWLQYYKIIREDLQEMTKYEALNNAVELRRAFESLQHHYEIIRPAVVIQKKPYEVQMIDSWMSYAGGLTLTSGSDAKSRREMIKQGEGLLNTLFGKEKDEPVFASITVWQDQTLWISCILLFMLAALGYTGYRKYRAEQENITPVPPKL